MVEFYFVLLRLVELDFTLEFDGVFNNKFMK